MQQQKTNIPGKEVSRQKERKMAGPRAKYAWCAGRLRQPVQLTWSK